LSYGRCSVRFSSLSERTRSPGGLLQMATTLQSWHTVCSSLVLSRTLTGLSSGALRWRKSVNSSVGYSSRTRLGRPIALQDLASRQTASANSVAPSRRRQHMLASCSYSQSVWTALASWIGVSVDRPPSLDFGRLKVWWRSRRATWARKRPRPDCRGWSTYAGISGRSNVVADMITRPCRPRRSSKSSSLSSSNGPSPGVKCLLRLRQYLRRLIASSCLSFFFFTSVIKTLLILTERTRVELS
jgi:hypothetical protein